MANKKSKRSKTRSSASFLDMVSTLPGQLAKGKPEAAQKLWDGPLFDGFVSLRSVLESSEAGLPLSSVKKSDRKKSAVEEGHGSPTPLLAQTVHLVPLEKPQDGALTVSMESVSKDISSVTGLEELLVFVVERLIPKFTVTLSDDSSHEVKAVTRFVWRFVPDEYVNVNWTLFVEFEDILALYLFKKVMGELGMVSSSSNIGSALKKVEQLFSVEEPSDWRSELQVKYEELKKSVSEGNLEEMDGVESGGERHVFDSAELTGIPADMLETVKKSILDFLDEVDNAEKIQGQKQGKEEKIDAQKKVGKLLDSIDNETFVSEKLDVDMDEEDSKEKEDTVEKDEEKENRKKDGEYVFKLEHLREAEKGRAKCYAKYLQEVKHDVYVRDFVPAARQKFLQQYVEGVKDEDNKIDHSFKSYTRHSVYLKYRAGKKEDEAKKDAKDREQDTASSEATSFTLNFGTGTAVKEKKPMKISIKKRRRAS